MDINKIKDTIDSNIFDVVLSEDTTLVIIDVLYGVKQMRRVKFEEGKTYLFFYDEPYMHWIDIDEAKYLGSIDQNSMDLFMLRKQMYLNPSVKALIAVYKFLTNNSMDLINKSSYDIIANRSTIETLSGSIDNLKLSVDGLFMHYQDTFNSMTEKLKLVESTFDYRSAALATVYYEKIVNNSQMKDEFIKFLDNNIERHEDDPEGSKLYNKLPIGRKVELVLGFAYDNDKLFKSTESLFRPLEL